MKNYCAKMKTPSPMFYLLCVVTCVIIVGAHGVNIEVYKHENFTGLVWESNSINNCNNVPQDNYNVITSIRTDTCFIAFVGLNCYPLLSEKYLPGDHILSSDQIGHDSWIGSFYTCNEEEGGNQLNVDIIEWYALGILALGMLESYKNVCSCVNVPQHVQNMSKWSINNHHNNLLAYYESDCTTTWWNPKLIAAGLNDDSWDMHDHEKIDRVTQETYKIQSFGPNPNSTYFQTSCLSSEVSKESTKADYETTIENGTDINDDLVITGCQGKTNEIVELQKQVNESKQNQDKLQILIETIIKQHKDDFIKLNDKIVRMQEQLLILTE